MNKNKNETLCIRIRVGSNGTKVLGQICKTHTKCKELNAFSLPLFSLCCGGKKEKNGYMNRTLFQFKIQFKKKSYEKASTTIIY